MSSKSIYIEMEQISIISKEVQREQDHANICRICHDNTGTMIAPCLCDGTLKFVHQDCLQKWLKHSRKLHCTICQFKYEMGQQISIMKFLKSMSCDFRMWMLLCFIMLLTMTAFVAFLLILLVKTQDVQQLPTDLYFSAALICSILYSSLVIAMLLKFYAELRKMRRNGIGKSFIKNISDEFRMLYLIISGEKNITAFMRSLNMWNNFNFLFNE